MLFNSSDTSLSSDIIFLLSPTSVIFLAVFQFPEKMS